MMNNTGNKCVIFNKIDALKQTRTHAELVAGLINILNDLAYHAINSDSSILETQEEWHGEFTDRLYNDAGADRKNVRASTGDAKTRSGSSRAPDPSSRRQGVERESDHGLTDSIQSNRSTRATGQRQAAGDLPASLRAIMDGRHASQLED